VWERFCKVRNDKGMMWKESYMKWLQPRLKMYAVRQQGTIALERRYTIIE
jgi:hypothetical protein